MISAVQHWTCLAKDGVFVQRRAVRDWDGIYGASVTCRFGSTSCAGRQRPQRKAEDESAEQPHDHRRVRIELKAASP
jgi:hypothetical protein